MMHTIAGRMILVPVLLVSLFFLLAAFAAAEVEYPVAAFSDEELARVREWESQWVGKKIDKNNIDAVAAFLPDAFVEAYKDPKKWGAPDDAYFMITAYQQFIDTPGMISATKRYAPLVTMGADGRPVNFADIAGVPFPAPKNGQELAVNFDFNSRGDSSHYFNEGPVVTPGVRMERTTKTERWELAWIHRVDVPPLPKFADNKKGIHRGMFQHMYDPPESTNTRYYNIRYIDPAKSDDGYMYYAPFRRIRRISVGQRTDTIDGSDFIYDDEYGWDGNILRNTYESKGRRDLLASRRTDLSKYERVPGQAIPSNIVRERINTYVVEVKSKDPNYIYGKRIWYLDPETYLNVWTEIYDDLGRFWKCFECLTTEFPSAMGGTKMLPSGYITLDVQRTHACNLLSSYIAVGLESINPRMFTITNLQRTY